MSIIKVENSEGKGISSAEIIFDMMARLYLGEIREKKFFEEKRASAIESYMLFEIENKMRQNPGSEGDYSNLVFIVRKFYNLMNDPKVRDEVLDKKLSFLQFKEAYLEDITGILKRNYDMSGLFNPKYVMQRTSPESIFNYPAGARVVDSKVKIDKDKLKPNANEAKRLDAAEKRIISYEGKEGAAFKYAGKEGVIVTIQQVGTLHVVEWNGVVRDLPKYVVQKSYDDGKNFSRAEVYSYIDMYKLIHEEDKEYEEVVIKELLKDKNIQLSNAGGYVGEIIPTPEEVKNSKKPEVMAEGNYYYRINDTYTLKYDGIDLTGAVMYESRQSKKQIDNGNEER